MAIVQRLVVFGLGKLGGGELNFSSDVDLVYAYEHEGESDGARSLDAQDWFARLGQQLAKLLDEVTADGFCHRVDLRLRPFGNAGRVALSFAAMEHYFLTEGRDWERYAWQKARPVAGDLAAGERLLQALRPFVYRRYLDYGALDGLRTMKAAIAAEVARKDMADDIKRGPGRHPRDRIPGAGVAADPRRARARAARRRLLPALRALVEAGHVDAAAAPCLLEAYRFLRTLENRLQMLGDAQTHALPQVRVARARIAEWAGLCALAGLAGGVGTAARARVRRIRRAAGGAPRGGRRQRPGFVLARPAGCRRWRGAGRGRLRGRRGPASQPRRLRPRAGGAHLSDATRARLDRVLPALLQAAVASPHPDAVLRRLLPLLHMLLRRASYLALLDEQPVALHRLVDALARSALLGERLAAHPLLLDELLDVRIGGELPGREAMHQACGPRFWAMAMPTPKPRWMHSTRVRQALSFRIALALLDRRIEAQDCARRLAWLADAVVDCVLKLALAGMHAAHGGIDGARFAVLGYGSLGGEELGFGSDLDLVFLYDAPEARCRTARARWMRRAGSRGSARRSSRCWRPAPAPAACSRSTCACARMVRRACWCPAWPVSPTTSASARGPGNTRRWCARVRSPAMQGCSQPFEGLRGESARARTRCRCAARGCVCDAPAHARGAGPQRCRAVRPQAGRRRPGRPGIPAAVPAAARQRRTHPGLLHSACVAGDPRCAACEGVLDANMRAALQVAHATLLDAGMRCTLDRRPRRVPATNASSTGARGDPRCGARAGIALRRVVISGER
jgi:glutamate-ammonia-ligase adenylyltransferase